MRRKKIEEPNSSTCKVISCGLLSLASINRGVVYYYERISSIRVIRGANTISEQYDHCDCVRQLFVRRTISYWLLSTMNEIWKCIRDDCARDNNKPKRCTACLICKIVNHLLCYGIVKTTALVLFHPNIKMLCDSCLERVKIVKNSEALELRSSSSSLLFFLSCVIKQLFDSYPGIKPDETRGRSFLMLYN